MVEFLLPGALAVEDIAKALHEDVAVAQHVAEPTDIMRIGDRLVERLAEVVRAQMARLVLSDLRSLKE